VELYQRGNWFVSTPILVFNPKDPEKGEAMMICPHSQWAEVKREMVDEDPDAHGKYLAVSEKCTACSSIRVRLLPESVPQEPFDYSIPTEGSWYERLYNLGNFVLLVRRYNNNPEVPPTYMTRVETQSGSVQTSLNQLPTALLSPAAVRHIEDMEKLIKLGPKRYVDFRILKEAWNTKEDKDLVRAHAENLVKVIQEIGPESIGAAKSILQTEEAREDAEMEVASMQEQEAILQEMKAMIEKRRSESGK
jgi:hypothetical protein